MPAATLGRTGRDQREYGRYCLEGASWRGRRFSGERHQEPRDAQYWWADRDVDGLGLYRGDTRQTFSRLRRENGQSSMGDEAGGCGRRFAYYLPRQRWPPVRGDCRGWTIRRRPRNGVRRQLSSKADCLLAALARNLSQLADGAAR